MKIDFKIICADTWREIAPRADGPQLLLEKEGRLLQLQSDFKVVHDYGAVGPVDCPIAYDPVRRLAFRYVCASGYQRGDFSQLRAFSTDHGKSYPLKELSLSQWALWMLEWIAPKADDSGQLFGLLASDRRSEDQIMIEHQLFAYKPGEKQLRRRLLCRDAYKPLAFSRKRSELVFAGSDGIYLLSLRGERKLSLTFDHTTSDQAGHGATFCPLGKPRVILGGDGLHLWDLERNTCLRLTRNGRHPVWSPDGRGIWYRESSADLHYYDFEQDETQIIIGSDSQRHPEFWHARPVCLSRCGRYLASSISEKVLRGVSAKGNANGKRERVYVHHHKLLILDLHKHVFWQQPGFANHLRWVE
jgi:hypothetical protein